MNWSSYFYFKSYLKSKIQVSPRVLSIYTIRLERKDAWLLWEMRDSWDPAGGPQEVGHACVTTGRRGFSMPTFFPGGSAHAPWKASILEWKSKHSLFIK